jgi:hypothetical protein
MRFMQWPFQAGKNTGPSTVYPAAGGRGRFGRSGRRRVPPFRSLENGAAGAGFNDRTVPLPDARYTPENGFGTEAYPDDAAPALRGA